MWWLSLLALANPWVDLKPGQLGLVGAGDIATCGATDDEKTAVLVERELGRSDAVRAFTLGDNVYPNGTAEEFTKCYEPSWGRFKSRTIPVVGNHDYRQENAAGFRGIFAGRFTQKSKLWYSVDIEGAGSDGAPARWHVVVLDSNCDKVDCTPSGVQYKWLQRDLRLNKNTKCTLALFHHPRFSSGPHGDAVVMSALWNALDEGGVDLVLSGHDHVYERFAPLTSDGEVVAGRGVSSIVVGTGGASHYPIVFTHDHSLAKNTEEFGVLALALDDSGWTGAFLPVGGGAKDVHTGTCRGPTRKTTTKAPMPTEPTTEPTTTPTEPTTTPEPTAEAAPAPG